MPRRPAAVSPDAAESFLLGRIDYERTPRMPYGAQVLKLDRMRQLLTGLGDPQQGMRIVHIAGTKGKGSTAAIVTSILQQSGLRTGLFSSPHLFKVEERLAVDGAPCTREELASLVAEIRPIVEQMDAQHDEGGPTYFEIITALALLHFARRKVDWAVLEVGLGGRLDSTNVCVPQVALVTSISYDHMTQLGNTLTKIAREKAGIIKPGIPTISGVITPEPAEVIRAVCREQGSPLWELGRDFMAEYRPEASTSGLPATAQFDFRWTNPERGGEAAPTDWTKLPLPLIGQHQAANAALAIAAVHTLQRAGHAIADSAIRPGLAEVKLPARIEVVCREPVVIVDAAHNVASIEALTQVLADVPRRGSRTLVFATSRDKEAAGMLRCLAPCFERIILTRYVKNPRGIPPEELAQLPGVREHSRVELYPDPAAAWEAARAGVSPQDLICITGSFYLAAEIRPVIDAAPPESPHISRQSA